MRDFGIAQTAAFPEGSFGKELFATVAQVVAKLDNQSASQSSGIGEAQSVAKTKSATRVDLREMIKAINRTATVIAFETPGLDTNSACRAAPTIKPCSMPRALSSPMPHRSKPPS